LGKKIHGFPQLKKIGIWFKTCFLINMKRNNIFIIDDDADDRKIILDAFKEDNPQVDYTFFENAESFLKTLYSSTQLPDLILLDLNMPGMLGLQVLKELKSSRTYAVIPIIILTTSVREKDKQNAYEIGVNCFLQKPQSYSGFLHLTKAILLLWFDIQ